MRFYSFIALIFIALILDLGLLAFGLAAPAARLFAVRSAPVAQAAARPAAAAATPTSTQPPTAQPSPTVPAQASQPTAAPSPTSTPNPTAMPTSTPSPTPPPTATPAPQLLAAKSVSFTPSNRAVRANIRLALAHYDGALTHVVLGPGNVFSFNATLGARPQRLPWKYVVVKPTPAPTPAGAAPDAAPAEPDVQSIQGGGLCDLASRFVMAARPILPARAFHFVNHVKSNGIHLQGVPARDSVSIWAVGGGPGEQDLTITNLTSGWLEFTVDRAGEKITVTARLWDQSPPGW
jgi:hypothetical protein